MIEKCGNIFDQKDADAICFTSNGVVKFNGELTMGAGVALAFKKKWGYLPAMFGRLVKEYGNMPHVVRVSYKINDFYTIPVDVVSFPTKHHWRDPSDLALIVKSAELLAIMSANNEWGRVYLPYPGIGLGGLKKSEVREAIKDILDDRFVVLYL